MLVNATLGFGDEGIRIEVRLPDENYIREILAKASAAVAEGKKQFLHLIFEAAPDEPFPRHGFIEFRRSDEPLNVEGEGPWWLYVRHQLTAKDIMLKIKGDFVNVWLML
jgi:hypothetical protein